MDPIYAMSKIHDAVVSGSSDDQIAKAKAVIDTIKPQFSKQLNQFDPEGKYDTFQQKVEMIQYALDKFRELLDNPHMDLKLGKVLASYIGWQWEEIDSFIEEIENEN